MQFAHSASIRFALAVLVIAIGVSTVALAQYRAGIQGAVTDSQGAAVAGATVTLTSKETNRTQTTKSGEGGFYRFDRLSPGSYSISAEMANFKKKMLENVEVKAEDIQGINIVLETGNISETITVTTAVTAQLETENANIDRSITKEEILRLPQSGRDPYELARLTPGVFGLGARSQDGGSVRLPNSSGPGGSGSDSIFHVENGVPISANGQRLQANNYEIDGVAVNSQAWGGHAVVTPNQESVKEVRVVANSYSAEYGRNTGALVQVVSQNGTNDFHGSAVFKYNSPSLNAFNRWGGPTGAPPTRVDTRFRQYGGSIGGPIYLPRFGQGGRSTWNGKDKLFFFFSFERLTKNFSGFSNKWVETPQFRQLMLDARPGGKAGQILNLSGMAPGSLTPIANSCAAADDSLVDVRNCQAVAGGLDIGSPMGAIGATVPQVGGGLDGIPDIMFAQIVEPGSSKAIQYNGRVDFQATSSDLFAFSFYYIPADGLFSTNGRPVLDFLSARRTTAGALIWNHTFSPTLLNEARFNFTRWYFNEFESNPNMPWGIPHVSVGDALPFIDWSVGGAGVFYQTTFNFRDNLSKVVGSHGLKFGGEISKEQNNDTVAWAARPDYFFGNLWNFANDAPIRESGFYDPRTGVPTDLKKYIRAATYSLFVQDDWKVKPNLTLNLGMRWEYWEPLREKFGNLSKMIFGPGPNPLVGARFVLGESLHEPDRNNFGPQIAFAWSPERYHNKAVVRGGFGIGFNRIPYSITLNGRLNPPFLGSFTFENESRDNIFYQLGSDLNDPGSFGSNPAAIMQFGPDNIPTNIPAGGGKPNAEWVSMEHVPNPYTLRYSLDVQYELGSNWIASLGYQGSGGRKFPRYIPYHLFFQDQPAGLGQIKLMPTDVNTSYNAMNARLSRRFSAGLNVVTQYRWSKSIDTCSDDQNCFQSYPFDQSTERGPSDYDVTHHFTASGLWDLPFFRRRSDAVGKVLGGWQLNGIVTASSGYPWTPVYNADCGELIGKGNICPLRPIAYAGGLEQNLSDEAFMRPGGSLGLNAANSFTPPPRENFAVPPRPGIGRNVFRGPGYFNIDLSTAKRFGLPKFFGENAGLDIRANFFNAFNQLNLRPFDFNSESTQVNHDNFGRAVQALAGRVIEFQARFFF